MTENVFTPQPEPQSEPNVAPQPGTAQRRLAEEPQDLRLSGCGLARDCGGAFQLIRQETPGQQASTKGQPPQPALQDNTDSNVQEWKNQLQAERQKEQQATLGRCCRWEIQPSHLRRPSSRLPPRPTVQPVLPSPVFRASPARKRSRANMQMQLTPVQRRHS